MAGRIYKAKIIEIEEMAPGVMKIQFSPQAKITFTEGQFISLQVKDPEQEEPTVWRAYSLASAARKDEPHELCVKLQPNGRAAKYIRNLQAGDIVQFRAAYGDFIYRTKSDRGVCFIGTGTGVAPLRSIIRSEKFRKEPPLFSLALLGFRTQEDILYQGEFERLGVKTYYALSQEDENTKITTKGATPLQVGRIPSLLARLKDSFPWSDTDFYLCGNGDMIEEAIRFLKSKGVQQSAIFAEAFGGTPQVQTPKKAA